MPNFRINYQERTWGHAWIEADTAEEALQRFQNGECAYDTDTSEDQEITSLEEYPDMGAPEAYNIEFVRQRVDVFGGLRDQYGDRVPMNLVALPNLGEQYLNRQSLRQILDADWYEDEYKNLWIVGTAIPEEAEEEITELEDVLEGRIIHTLLKVEPVLHRFETEPSLCDPEMAVYVFFHA